MGRIVLAIDPGTESSGLVFYDPAARVVRDSGDGVPNDQILKGLFDGTISAHQMVIETVQNQGLPIGDTTIETAIWIGKFSAAWEYAHPGSRVARIRRSDEQIALCGRTRYRDPKTGGVRGVTDAQIRAAVIARHAPTGGGKVPQVGVTKARGPLYGVKGHAWSALAVAMTWLITDGTFEGWE